MTTKLEDDFNKYVDAIITKAKSLKKRPMVLEEALADIPLQKEMAARNGQNTKRNANVPTY